MPKYIYFFYQFLRKAAKTKVFAHGNHKKTLFFWRAFVFVTKLNRNCLSGLHRNPQSDP